MHKKERFPPGNASEPSGPGRFNQISASFSARRNSKPLRLGRPARWILAATELQAPLSYFSGGGERSPPEQAGSYRQPYQKKVRGDRNKILSVNTSSLTACRDRISAMMGSKAELETNKSFIY